jgi:hypothetical protein
MLKRAQEQQVLERSLASVGPVLDVVRIGKPQAAAGRQSTLGHQLCVLRSAAGPFDLSPPDRRARRGVAIPVAQPSRDSRRPRRRAATRRLRSTERVSERGNTRAPAESARAGTRPAGIIR